MMRLPTWGDKASPRGVSVQQRRGTRASARMRRKSASAAAVVVRSAMGGFLGALVDAWASGCVRLPNVC